MSDQRQFKSYARLKKKQYFDDKHRAIEFQLGDFIYMKIKSMKGNNMFGREGKLSPRYVGPFKVVERIRKYVY